MIPDIFNTVKNHAPATALIGTSPTRFYPAGNAPQNTQTPYATYQIISGLPENYINQTPDVDEFGLQVDIFSDKYSEVISLSTAIRDAVEPHAHITAWRGGEREAGTMLYRYSFDVAWHVKR